MSEGGQPPRLWEGMLEIYAAPGVSRACVEAQDACGVDVLLLLSAVVLARSGLRLSPSMADAMLETTRHWQSEVVLPLRVLRRRWRGNPAAAELRERVKAIELEAERVEVEALQAVLDAGTPPPEATPGGELLADNLAVLDICSEKHGDCAAAMASLRDCLRRALGPDGRHLLSGLAQLKRE